MSHDQITPQRPRPLNLVAALLRAHLTHADNAAADASVARAGGIVGGTAPAHVVARRRAANKVARASRRANRRSAR